jgi:cytochrome P450
LSNPRAILGTKQRDEKVRNDGHLLKMLVNMDAPEHTGHRQFVADWFRPRNLDALEPRLKELAEGSVQRMIDADGECDFARDIAMPFPLETILAILGLPESDYPRMLKLTQEIFAPEDPEQARSPEMLASMMATIQDFMAYFAQLSAARIAAPTEDLASAIAHGEISGCPISMPEQIGHYVLIATAGHDTTSSAMSGGLLALIQNPDQLRLLQEDPSRLDSAVEEMLRWTSPVKHFMRTATEDIDINGTLIRAGQDVLLSYWSANFDEDVFDDPFVFDITRSPNKHLAFGFGAHYCLGATLARRELRALFGELVPRIRFIELAGEAEFTPATFVSGLKRLPIRYELI